MIESCPACLGELRKKSASVPKRLVCLDCRTEVIPERRNFLYAETYATDRGHHSTQVDACKRKSYLSHLHTAEIQSLKYKKILEFGFGGGSFLKLASEEGATIYGIEIQKNLIQKATELGIPKENLASELDSLFSVVREIDTIFYFDSFEHLLNPEAHLRALNPLTKTGSQALVIMPRVDSLSHSLLGMAWPHDVSEHWILFSQSGLLQMWQRQGWKVQKTFVPKKNISLEMILRHAHIQPSGFFLKLIRSFPSFWFNFGEMGVLFEKIK